MEETNSYIYLCKLSETKGHKAVDDYQLIV